MEARLKTALLLFAIVLAIRLPFLDQAIQGDDIYYLAGAQHAQIDPAHPNHARYAFLGDMVDMRGHPHPPLNVWCLAALLAVFADIRETPFHAAYILFSLIAVFAMWSLARRFSTRPVWATLLFIATPAFVINGNSLESDIPFLAFWMSSIALFVSGRRIWAAAAMSLAALAAYQAIFLTPILAVYVWLFERRSRQAWALVLVPPLALGIWQLYELLSTGDLPAAVLSSHFQTYGFQALANKLRNAAALSVHATWLVFPLLLPPAIVVAWKRKDRDTAFLAAWIAIFFAGALVVFFSGSARYLLPMAAPVALLVSRLPVRWLASGFAVHLALGLALAFVNYQHWDGYRAFASSLRPHSATRRVWINGEWGLRFYLEADGGLPLLRGQAVQPGQIVVSSELAYPVAFTTGGGVLTPLAEREIRPSLPLRLIALNTRSAYSTAIRGYWPFDVSRGPIDRVKAELVVERHPTLEYLPMNAPEAGQQIISGLHDLESGSYRWTGQRAVVMLKSPDQPKRLRAVFRIHDRAPARRVFLLLDGEQVADQSFPGPGAYTIQSMQRKPARQTATVTLIADQIFIVPGDRRELGLVLLEVGFR